jgi:hypothetical protein
VSTAAVAPKNGTPPIGELIVATERELVLHAWEELKRRGDGELRITTRRDPKTGLVEIVYCGVHQKADIEALRNLYQRMRKQGFATFGS